MSSNKTSAKKTATATAAQKKQIASSKSEASRPVEKATVAKKANTTKQPPPETTEKANRQRRVVNAESVKNDLQEIRNSVKTKLDEVKEEKNDTSDKSKKTKNVKPRVDGRFLNSLEKMLARLDLDFNKALKLKPKTNRQKNNNSGFLKPVKISPQLADFTGWDQKELHSRVEATKFLCQYIKENKLYDENDKRNFTPDDKLQDFLESSPLWKQRDQKEPLSYFRIQKYIQCHFSPSDLPDGVVPQTPRV